MNNDNNYNYKKAFTTINILFFALLTGQIIYFIIGLFLVQSCNMEGIPDLNTILMFITPVIVLSSILAAKFIYTKQVASFDRALYLEDKLGSYRKTNIVKLALLEGANIFTISVMIVTANYFFAALFIILISFFFLNKPTKEKFILDYEINSEEVLKILA